MQQLEHGLAPYAWFKPITFYVPHLFPRLSTTAERRLQQLHSARFDQVRHKNEMQQATLHHATQVQCGFQHHTTEY